MTDTNRDKLESVSSDKQATGINVEDLLTNPNFSAIFREEKQPVIVCGDPNKSSDSKAALYLEFSKIPQFIEPLVSPKWDQKPSRDMIDALKSPPADIRHKADSLVDKILELLNQPKNGGDRCEPGRSPEPAPSAPDSLKGDIPNSEAGLAGSPAPGPTEPFGPAGPDAGFSNPSGSGSGSGHGLESFPPPSSLAVRAEDILERWANQTHQDPAKDLLEMLRNIQHSRFHSPYTGHLPEPPSGWRSNVPPPPCTNP